MTIENTATIYNTPGVYNQGQGGGGGGGGSGFIIKKNFGFRGQFFLNYQDKALEPIHQYGGNISISCRERLYLNDINKIDIKLDLYQKSSSNYEQTIFSYGSNTSNYDTGRLFLLRRDGADIVLKTAIDNSTWQTAFTEAFDLSGRHQYQVKCDLISNKIELYIDEVKKHESNIVFKPQFWCPSFSTETFVIGGELPASYLDWVNDVEAKLYLEQTYIKINDEIIFGYV